MRTTRLTRPGGPLNTARRPPDSSYIPISPAGRSPRKWRKKDPLGSVGDSPSHFLRLRPDCEGILYQLTSCTDRIPHPLAVFSELTDGFGGI